MTLTQKRVREMFHYDPETGHLTRRITSGGQKAGTIAGCSTSTAGYIRVRVNDKKYLAHRLIWLHQTGALPGGKHIDHINGDGTDNRWQNLRLVTPVENGYNTTKGRDNKSGFKGVSWNSRLNKWIARISVDKRPVYVGVFDDPSEAGAAVRAVRERLHGDYCNHGAGHGNRAAADQFRQRYQAKKEA